MPDITVQVNRDMRGGLDTNSDEYNIQGGNYPDRVNVERNNDGSFGSETGSIGTTVAYTIDDVSLQNQRVRVYLDAPFFTQATIQLLNVSGQIIRFSNPVSSATLSANKSAIKIAITAWGLDAQFFNDTSAEPYIDVEIDTQYSDYQLIVTREPDDVVYRTRVLREALSKTAVGPLYLIGSREVNSLNVLCYTPQTKKREKLKDIVSVQADSGTVVVEAPAHGLQDNESIILARMSGAAAAFNGEWTVTVLDENFIRINFAIAGGLPITPTFYGGIIYSSPYGYGCFVFQSYNSNNDTYSYSIPLRSKKLNWSTLFQIDIDIKYFNKLYACQIADYNNRPRTVYFEEPLSDDSAIISVNPDVGRYDYETLTLQINTQQDFSGIRIALREQRQSGGSLDSGGWLYAAVLVTEELTETEPSDLTDIAFVYEPVYNGTTNVYGTYGSTNKANSVQVTNIQPGIYKYIDLIAVYISGSQNNLTATEAFVVSRTALGDDQTSIILDHTGNEIDIRGYDLLQLASVRTSILKNKCNVYGENRCLIANFTTSQQFDISEWMQTVKYSIKRFPIFSDFGAENVNGFAQPFLSPNQNGYQLYEWYRFYGVAEFLEGGETDATFLFDARLVTQSDYTASFGTSDDFRFLETNGTDRRNLIGDELTTYDLGDSGRNLYQFYFDVNGVDWNFQFDGRPASEIFRRIKICRAERVKEVLSSGCGILGFAQSFDGESDQIGNTVPGFPSILPVHAYRYLLTDAPGAALSGGQVVRDIFAYYSPDTFFGIDDGEVLSGDSFLNFGQYRFVVTETGTNLYDINNWWVINNADLGGPTQVQKVGVANSKFFAEDELSPIGPYYFSKQEWTSVVGSPFALPLLVYGGKEYRSQVIHSNEDVQLVGSNTDRFFYHMAQFRRLINKYGTTSANNNVLYTGASIERNQSSASVFGGDVYTQQTWFRNRYPALTSGYTTGGAMGINIISQNTLNTQLRVYDSTNTTNLIIPYSAGGYIAWLDSPAADQITKNAAYSVVKNQQYKPVFDPDALDRSEYKTRIWASEVSPNGSVKDFNRVFLPSTFRDNPINFGEIVHLDIKQGELFSLQELCYTREFLLENGRLGTLESGNVIIGDGEVLSREGIRLTQLGSKHKWSYARGLTDAGNDVRAWVNSDFFVVLRSGADGTVNLTTRTMMDTFMRTHMRFVKEKYNPAHGQGIHATWDNRGKQFVITARGWKDSTPWRAGSRYDQGDTVTEGELYGVPIIYESKSFQISTEETRPGTVAGEQYWSKKEFNDTNYYSLWTLCFNEQNNRFTHFQTFYPRIYTNHFDRYFSPNPKAGMSGELNLHRSGETLVFYGEEHEGYSERVVNYQEFAPKIFVAMAYNSTLAPFKVSARTLYSGPTSQQNRETEMVRDEFTFKENSWRTPIKRAKNVQGETGKDTARIVGFWLRIKTFFKARENQKINDIFVSTRIGQRTPKNS